MAAAPVKCPECDYFADLTKDGKWAHCASCNNIFQPSEAKKEEGDKGSDQKETGEKEETK